MNILVKYLVTIKEKTGLKEEIIQLPDGSVLNDLVNQLNKKYSFDLPSSSIMVILNGKGWGQLRKGLDTAMKEGDMVCLFPPISGG